MRVYERYPGGPIHVEFTGGGRESLRNLADVPVVDRALAVRIANRLSQKMDEGSTKSVARELLGLKERRRVEELLERYCRDHETSWSESHRRSQARLRDWWTDRLGADTALVEVTEAKVEAVVRKAGDARAWTKRNRQKYLRFIMAAFRYGRRKLKWIEPKDELTGVDVPKPKRGGPSYTRDEMRRLLEAAPSVDVRVSAALEVAYDTAARARAIRHLRWEDLDDELLTFRAKYDKADKARVAVLSGTSQRAIRALREERGDRGWMFGTGARPLSYERMRELLWEVEDAAGIPRRQGFGWHSVKRRATTDARAALGDMGPVSKQSGTLASTLELVYDQDDLEPKRRMAEAMEALRGKG